METHFEPQALPKSCDSSPIHKLYPRDRRRASVMIHSSGQTLFPQNSDHLGSNNPYLFIESSPSPSASDTTSPNQLNPIQPASMFTQPLPQLGDSSSFSPKTAQLSPTSWSEPLMEPLGLHDSDTVLWTNVNSIPEGSPFSDPEPLTSFSSDESSENRDDNRDESMVEREVENIMLPSPSGDSLRPSSPSQPEPTLRFPSSSETSNTFDSFACHSLECGVNVPHNIGPCLYMSDLPKHPCGPYPWGESLSPQCIWSALEDQFHRA